MKDYNSKFFTTLSRVVKFWGYCAVVIGGLICIVNILRLYVFTNSSLSGGEEAIDPIMKFIMVAFPFVLAVLGWLIIRAKPITRENNPEFFASFEVPERAKQPWEK